MEKKRGSRLDVETPPGGFPEVAFMSMAPLVEELEALKRHAERALEMNSSDPAGRILAWTVERLRTCLWEAASCVEEGTPQSVGEMLSVSPDTVIYWCRKGYVRYRKNGRAYFVDVSSAAAYAAGADEEAA